MTLNEASKDIASKNAGLSRHDLNCRCVGQFKIAGGTRPDLKLIDLDGRLAVLKDYRHSDPLFRNIVAPILVRRERGALLKLNGVEGAPAVLSSIDRCALLIEHIQGTTLRQVDRDVLGPDFFRQLENLIGEIHRAGIAHCDLRTGGNIMVGNDGRPYLIDFASCVFLGRGLNPIIRWLFGQFCRADLFAVLLAKRKVSPSLLTPEDEEALARSLPFERPAIFIGKSIRRLTRRLLTRRRE